MLKARQLLGKYKIEARLGEGGFATVYRARDMIEGIKGEYSDVRYVGKCRNSECGWGVTGDYWSACPWCGTGVESA